MIDRFLDFTGASILFLVCCAYWLVVLGLIWVIIAAIVTQIRSLFR